MAVEKQCLHTHLPTAQLALTLLEAWKAAVTKMQSNSATKQQYDRETARQTSFKCSMQVWCMASRGAAMPSEVGIFLCNEWVKAAFKRRIKDKILTFC